jgi:hypothetical protein
MRWTFAGLLAAGGLITVFCLGWSLPPAAPERAAEDGSWQVRELAYLKSAYDRMQQERLQQAGEGEIEGGASLRREQQRIIRQMAQTATLLPNEAVSDELRALLQGAASMSVPAPLPAGKTEAERPNPERPAPRLQVGFTGEPRPVVQFTDFAIDPELRESIRAEPIPVGSARVEPASRRKPRDASARPH